MKRAAKKLVDLDARFLGAGGEGVFNADGSPAARREGVGLTFECPCGGATCVGTVYVAFKNPIDGGPPYVSEGRPTWTRTGEDLATLTLAPSILRKTGCGWHGWVRNGEVITC